MEERARSCLLRSRAVLEQDIKASYLMDHMISDKVLTADEEDKISSMPTRREQAIALIDLVLQKDNRAYISLYNALIRESYGDLACLLQQDLPLISPEAQRSYSDGGTPYVQTVLIEGGVPQRPVVFVSRPGLVNQIREKLYKLNNDPGWVTVFGMAGSGKSVLAAESVRDESLLKECFPGGVHWLSVGQLETAGLLVKIQSLCFRLEQALSSAIQRAPSSIEEARDRLRYLMFHKYPRSLLILDDIWDSVVLKAFDLQCRVLLTTRDRSVVDAVSGQRAEVQVESNLDQSKALEVLSLYVKKKPQELPEQARSIVRECKCSPLVVSLIGALLHDFPDRWDYYLQQLRLKRFRRIRKSSSYDYEALDQAMDASVMVLQEDYRDLYKDLTVLKKDVKVPVKVLSILWDLEPEEVEDVLQEFVNKSLLFRDCSQRPYLYYLHDLQLDFLIEQNRSRIQELHAKVVRQYQQFYKAGPPVSRDQECLYWFKYLTYHMAQAGLSQELYKLMFSLDWVRTKAQIMGPAPLINDYVEHGTILDEESSFVRKQFQDFLSVNGHRLEQKPFPDVVQLGLAQPASSEVYRQAQLKACERAGPGALYLDWLNKDSLESLSRLVVTPLQGSIHCACFSRDGLKIASCGSNSTLQVFRTTSGEKLLDVRAHEDDVLCCAFSADDKFIATCSSDKKVKVWNAERGTLYRTFDDEHEAQVNFCQFTHTRRRVLLATCSSDGIMNLKLWNPNKQSSQNTLFGHTGAVHHCCFSPDDAHLATSSSDGSLKFWDVSSANEWKSIDVQSFLEDEGEGMVATVKCGSWSADGKRIVCAAKNAVFMFDVATGELLSEIRTSRLSTVQFCDCCPNSQLVAMGLSNYAVELWDMEAKKKVADCRGHLSWVHCVRFSPDGSLLLSSSSDQTFRLWETQKVHTSAAALKRDADVLFDGDDITIVGSDNKNRLQVRRGKTGEVVFQSETQESRIRCVGLCREPSAVAFGQDDGTVQVGGMMPARQVMKSISLWTLQLLTLGVQSWVVAMGLERGSIQVLEVPSGKVLCTLTGHTKTVLRCQFSTNGHTLITSSEDATIRVWKWRTGECQVLQGHKEQVRRFLLLGASCSSPRLLSWSYDGTVKVWNIVTGDRVQDITCHQGSVLSCDVSPDERLFATTSTDKTAKVWSLLTWSCVHELTGHNGCIRSCRFSWAATHLATGDDDGEIRLWSTADGSLLRICSIAGRDAMDSQHGGWVTDLHFSPDDRTLVSTGGYVKWWDVEKGDALQTFYTMGADLKGIHVSPDFTTFVTIDNIGILYILKKVE